MRLKAVNIAGAAIQHAVNDASGERALKGHGTVVSLGMNGKKYQYAARMGNYVRYVSGYSVVDRYGQLSKHYYAGSERIASRLAGPSTAFVDAEDLEGDHVDALPALQQMDIRIPVQGWGIGLGQGSFENVPLPGDECDNYTPGSEEYKQCICEQEGTCEEVIYWYHPDHLGSSTFLTDRFGQPYQFVMYLPFGETFAEQRAAGFGTPYLFNAKELDEETGLYYYGARYYDPRVSMWWGVDPLAGDAPDWTPYRYAFNNPVQFIDPDGMFEDKAAAKAYAKQEGIRTGWFGTHRIEENDMGTFDLINKKDGSFFNEMTKGVVSLGGTVAERGVHLKDIGMEGLNALADPYSDSYNPDAVVFTDAADIAYAAGVYMGFASPSARLLTAAKVGRFNQSAADDLVVGLKKQFGGNVTVMKDGQPVFRVHQPSTHGNTTSTITKFSQHTNPQGVSFPRPDTKVSPFDQSSFDILKQAIHQKGGYSITTKGGR